MILVKDDTKNSREPTEEERRFYCKPSQEEVRLSIIHETPKPPAITGNRVKDMINALERGGVNLSTKSQEAKFRIKEQGLKIGVKKNMTEEEKKNINEKK